MTVNELLQRFPDEDACKAHLKALRWPDGKVHCPRCNLSLKVYQRKNQAYRWLCKHCDKNGYGFSLTTGTIFEDTKIPLRAWFQVLFLMLNAKKGMSALQIQRTVFGQKFDLDGKVVGKGSYETTWYMCHRLRAAMRDENFRRLTGVVEVDETFIGGLERNKHKSKRNPANRGATGKVAVIGAIARKGNVVCKVIEKTNASTLQGFVNEMVSEDVSLVATDDASGYSHMDRPHDTVKHTEGEYVKESVLGTVHTQNLDSFWSLLKRGVVGTFHKVSKDYLPLYLNEFSFRHNQRGELNVSTFDRVLGAC